MSSAQMYDPITGANELQPCKFPTILHLSPPSHELKSDPYPFEKPQSPRYCQYQEIVTTPTREAKTLRTPRYHDHSCDHLAQKYHVHAEHSVPQSDVSKHGTSVSEGQQNSYLQGSVDNASGPERCQGLHKSRLEKAHGKDDQGTTRVRDPGQMTTAGAVSLRATITQPNGCQPPGAPSMRPVPLPKSQGGDEYISYYGLGLTPGWLMGTVQVDDVPKVLSHLDVSLPVPFEDARAKHSNGTLSS